MKRVRHTLSIAIATTLIFVLMPAISPAQDGTDTKIGLKEAAICRDVMNREPIGKGSVFPASIEQLYCFTKVVGATTETEISHHWYLNGKLKATVTLPVKSASWRTWSSKKIMPDESGDWMVEVLTADGEAIESILFFVQ